MKKQVMKKQVKHTPGPWKVVRSRVGRERYYEIWTDEDLQDDRPIAHGDGDNAVWLAAGEDIANARLIAAAPDLVAVLKAYLRVADYDETLDHIQLLDMLDPVAEQARAVLAKVEGRRK